MRTKNGNLNRANSLLTPLITAGLEEHTYADLILFR